MTRRPARRAGGIAIAAAALAAALACPAAAAEGDEERVPRREKDVLGGNPSDDWSFLDTPPFPGLDLDEAFRIHAGTLVAPEAKRGEGRVTLVRPRIGARISIPAGERLLLRVSARASASLYRFRGDRSGIPSLLNSKLDLYATRVALEGAWRLDTGPWLADGEIWSVLGSIAGNARWEDGGFDSGLGTTAGLGIGYELPDRLRVGLGVSLRSQFDEGGTDLGPFVSLRWDATERFTVRTQGLGLRLEYDLTPTLDVHAYATRESDGFRLNSRSGVPGDLSFRDRHLLFAVGFDKALASWLRLEVEAGSTAERRLRVRDDDLGTLLAQRVDPSFFLGVRFEVRL